jgi:hypothetical protein
MLLLFLQKDADLFLCCRLAYFKAAYALYDSDFYVKADDDIYLRPGAYQCPTYPLTDFDLDIIFFLMAGTFITDIYSADRLSLLLAKERSHTQTYIGCMKKGPVFTDPKLKWSVLLFSLV